MIFTKLLKILQPAKYSTKRTVKLTNALCQVVGDVLVIAGDIGYLVDTTISHLRFWKWASENYRQVLMVAGNHEYYNNGDIAASP